MTTALDGQADVNSTDFWTRVGTSARVIRLNPNLRKNASAVVVAQAGHAPHLERPAEVARLVRSFAAGAPE